MDESAIRAQIKAIDKTLAELKQQLERGYIGFGQYSRLKADWERQKAELEAQLSDTPAPQEKSIVRRRITPAWWSILGAATHSINCWRW